MGIRSFRNKATEDINYARATKTALKLLPQKLHRKAQVKLVPDWVRQPHCKTCESFAEIDLKR